jgi:hypothetical protein
MRASRLRAANLLLDLTRRSIGRRAIELTFGDGIRNRQLLGAASQFGDKRLNFNPLRVRMHIHGCLPRCRTIFKDL